MINIRLRSFALFFIVLCFCGASALGQSKLPESPIKTVYITPFSHYDFGFVESPEAVRERAARHIDEVIRVAEENPNFRWTIESVWQVNEWLKRQRKPTSVLPKDKQKIERLMKLIRSGQVAISMSWGSMHTDFMGNEELNRLTYDYTKLSRSYGIESELATLNDVPGHPTSMPSVLAGSGAKYMVTGANLFIGLSTSLAPGKVPFYWESPDGSRVLIWISQGTHGGYVEGLTDFYLDPYSLDPYTDKTPFDMFNPELAGKLTPMQIQEKGITELLERYNKAGYKHDAVMALYAHDFIEPTHVINLERAVREWNAKHNEVKLKIATMPEFFRYIEDKYRKDLPTYRGEWSGLWSESKTQSPRISALARYNHDHTPAAETLWSAIAMTRRIAAPVGNFTDLYDLMLTYDEHSGAGNNGWPQLNSREPLEEQNQNYVDYMTTAKKEADMLLSQGIKLSVQPTRFDDVEQRPATSRQIVVYNGLSFQRNDVVKIAPPQEGEMIASIKEAAANTDVIFDVDEKGNAIFVAHAVPAFGYKVYQITSAKGEPQPTINASSGTTAETKEFAIAVNADGSVKSIRDKRSVREIVNAKGEMSFNSLLRVEGNDASKVVYPTASEVSVRRGKVLTEIVVKREGSVYPLSKIAIYDGLGRVDIRNELDPKKFDFVGGYNNWSDAYYFAFPFNIDAAEMKVMRGGQKWFDVLPDDYLPEARRDSVSTQHLIGFSSGGNSALLAHRQAFHWVFPSYVSTKVRAKDAPAEFPAMFTGKFPLPEATIYSRAIRHSNQADTHDVGTINMRTVEPGLKGNYIFEYAFAGDGSFDPVAARRLGSAFNVPLIAKYVTAAAGPSSQGFFAVDQPNVEIVTVKTLSDTTIRGEVSASPLNPKVDKIFIIRLQEFAGKPAKTTIKLPVKIKNAAMVSLNEVKELQKINTIEPLTVDLKPFQTATIKIEIE